MGNSDFAIIGGGLAGCECALALASKGFQVTLFEQKPFSRSEAHKSDRLAELVCSNSLRSKERTSGIGLLKNEMRKLGSHFMQAADACAVPAGTSLAVDRDRFSAMLEEMVESRKNLRLVRKRIDSLQDAELAANGSRGIIVAAGPLASDGLAASLAKESGGEYLYFYDAIAPIVWTDSLDDNIVFRASRHMEGEGGDYLNCPMNREEYENFYQELLNGKQWAASCDEKHFEGCMPIEALAARGAHTLTYGPMKPVGLTDPRTGKRPWAVLQLRPEKINMQTCNLVGCQTKLLQGEQQRIFRLVPGMKNVEFVRYGSLHRNTYLNAPRVLNTDLSLRKRPDIFVAGQLCGVEGYVESAASALWLAHCLAKREAGMELAAPPPETALGGLLLHLKTATKNFQPSNAHFGLMTPFEEKVKKKERRIKYAERAEKRFNEWLTENGINEANGAV